MESRKVRKLVTGAQLSLDGVMQAPGAPEEDTTGGFRFGGWTVPYWGDDEAMGRFMESMFGAPFELLLGRNTYDIFAGYWPYHDDNPIGKAFNATRKHVATRSREPLAWQNSVAIHDAAIDVAKLKQQDGPLLLTQGSTVLLQTLLANDLVDELQLLVFPLVLGQGKRLFGDGATPAALKLIDSTVSKSGVVMTRYRRDGAVKTGSFGDDKPSAAEIARREKMRREG
jgi:dihydrofolate reductase